jgi:hypothetical protein
VSSPPERDINWHRKQIAECRSLMTEVNTDQPTLRAATEVDEPPAATTSDHWPTPLGLTAYPSRPVLHAPKCIRPHHQFLATS